MNTIEIKQSELLNKLPSSWSEVTLKDYIEKVIKLKVKDTYSNDFELLETYIDLASSYTGISQEMFRKMPMVTINAIYDRLQFLNKKPVPKKNTKYKWIKNITDPDFDTFIFYIRASDKLAEGDLTILPNIIKKICLDNLDMEEVEAMPMDEVETGFFLFRKCLVTYLNNIHKSLLRQVMKKEMKNKLMSMFSLTTYKNTKEQ